MKFISILILALAVIVFACLASQEPPIGTTVNQDPSELSLSIHYLDGLTATSSDHPPNIRFLPDGCHLSLLITNSTEEPIVLWKPDCPEGDSAISLEFKKAMDSEKNGIARPSHDYTGGMGIPKTLTLAAGDSLVYRIDFSSYWSLPFALEDGGDTKVFVRAVYDSKKARTKRPMLPKNAEDVWVGRIETEWDEVRLTNRSRKSVQSRNDTNILGTD